MLQFSSSPNLDLERLDGGERGPFAMPDAARAPSAFAAALPWFGVNAFSSPDAPSAVHGVNAGLLHTETAPHLSPEDVHPLTTTFVFSELPMPIVLAPGGSATLASQLSQDFGPNFGGYTDFWVTYYGATDLANADLSYWDLNHKSVGTWFVNGSDIGPGFAHQTYFPLSSLPNVTFKSGNDIGANAFLLVPTASSGGTTTEYTQYSIITIDPTLMRANAADGNPTPAEVVASAEAFNTKYGNVFNDNDCHFIAAAVAASVGATLADQVTQSLNPAENQEAGFWRIAYRGSDANPVTDWQTLVKPGDIVRMGWNDGTNGFHTTTVLSTNADGSMTVYDNIDIVGGKHTIGIHNANYDQQTIPTTITIYRLTTDHFYLINGTDASEHLAGTQFNDKIVAGAGDDTIAGWVGNDLLQGGAGSNTMDGGDGNDTINAVGGGNDTVTGDAGTDTFVFGAFFTAADRIDGGADSDKVTLAGNYAGGVVFTATTMVNVETISLGAGHNYSLTIDEATIAKNATLKIDATALDNHAHLTFDGSHDTNGHENILGGAGVDALTGGAGDDTITGGLGADAITPGAGKDKLVYGAVAQSIGKSYDTITGFDFAGADKFDLPSAVTVTSTGKVAKGELRSGAHFDGDLAHALKHMVGHEAVVFTPNSGTLSGTAFLIVDANGSAGYQAGEDMVFQLNGAVHPGSFDMADFT